MVVDCYVVGGGSNGSSSTAANGSSGSSSGSSGSGGGAATGAPGSAPITDMVSFYTLPSSVLGHPEHRELRAAYMFYTVAGTVPLAQLMQDAMALAAAKGYDVFNALDLLENEAFLKDLKFGVGDGTLQYYLYNWRVGGTPFSANETGLILL